MLTPSVHVRYTFIRVCVCALFEMVKWLPWKSRVHKILREHLNLTATECASHSVGCLNAFCTLFILVAYVWIGNIMNSFRYLPLFFIYHTSFPSLFPIFLFLICFISFFFFWSVSALCLKLESYSSVFVCLFVWVC